MYDCGVYTVNIPSMNRIHPLFVNYVDVVFIFLQNQPAERVWTQWTKTFLSLLPLPYQTN